MVTPAVKVLLIINIAIFLLQNILKIPWIYLALQPSWVIGRGMIWQLITYMFLHGNWFHLLINMYVLWSFGSAVEAVWGSKQFLVFYFFCGIGAAIISLLAYNSVIVGASGAILGLLIACAVMFPDNEIVMLLFFIIPLRLKMRHAVWIWVGIDLLGAMSSSSGIAHITHLGGALFGYIYLKQEWLRFKLAGLTSQKPKKAAKSSQQSFHDFRQQQNIDIEVDDILDKISKYGMNSLSAREREILQRKSRGGA